MTKTQNRHAEARDTRVSRRSLLGVGLVPFAAAVSTDLACGNAPDDSNPETTAAAQNATHGGLLPRLRKALDTIRLVDAHEHLPSENRWLEAGPDVISLIGYAGGDLVSAGMDKDAVSPGMDGAHITHTTPTHLTNLFLQYPQARFDLLHASHRICAN